MAYPTNEQTLRIVTAASGALGFPIILAAGIITKSVVSFLSFIPIACTVSLAFLSWRRSRKATGKDETPLAWLALDLANGLGYLGVLIPIWIVEPRRILSRYYWYSNTNISGQMMLETYGSCFLIANMMIHFYLALYRLVIVLHRIRRSPECPKCGETMIYPRPVMTKNHGKGPAYSLINDYADGSGQEGRPSTSESVTTVDPEV